MTRSLRRAGITVVVLQPLQVKAFAQLQLRRAKNDRIDATLIAACTHLNDAHNNMPPDARFEALGVSAHPPVDNAQAAESKAH